MWKSLAPKIIVTKKREEERHSLCARAPLNMGMGKRSGVMSLVSTPYFQDRLP